MDRSEIEQLNEWDKSHVWHAFTQMSEFEPHLIVRAKGSYLYDSNGRAYIDGVSNLWCNLLGHGHPRIDRAIREQLDQVAHVTSLGLSNPTNIRLAKKLVELAPGDLAHVFFSDSGATAVEVALKMAFQYWRQTDSPRLHRTKFIAFENAYHGDTIGSVSVGGVARFHEMFRPLLFDVVRLPMPDTYRSAPGVAAESLVAHYLEFVENALRAHHDEIAAIVVEPLMQCAAGMVKHPAGFLSGLRRLASEHEVLLIADEVAVGIGRTGTMFACQQENVAPDLLCLAKGLSGGYLPVAATMATGKIYQAFLGAYEDSKTFFHGHTYGGNALGCAAALATLEALEDERILEQLPPKVERLAERLARIAKHPNVGDTRQCGLIGAMELVRDRETKTPFPWSEKRGIRVCEHAKSLGVWSRPLGNVLVIMPPLTASLSEIDQICQSLEAGIVATLS